MRKLLLSIAFLPTLLLGQNVSSTLTFASITSTEEGRPLSNLSETRFLTGRPGLTSVQFSEILQSNTKSQLPVFLGTTSVLADSNIAQMLYRNGISYSSSSFSSATTPIQGAYTIQPIIPIQSVAWKTVLSTEGPYTEQLDADIVNIIRSDYSPSAAFTTTVDNGAPNFSLITRSNDFPNNSMGSFSINQGSNRVFSISVDSISAKIGWNSYAGTTLSLNGSRILTDGEIHAGSFISTSAGFLASDGNPQTLVPAGTLASLYNSHTPLTTLMISNQYSGSGSAAGVSLNANGNTGSLFSYANNDLSVNNSGTLWFESNNNRGLIINAIGANSESAVSIRFYLNTQETARFTNMGDFLMGTTVSDPSSVFTINSSTKGVRFPRMTQNDMKAIKDPGEGLVVYNMTIHKYCFFNSYKWEVISSYLLDQ